MRSEERINQLERQVEHLQKLVVTDPLTGIYNKRHFNESLHKELERTRRSRQPTSLIMLDIDHFKSINDQHGHLAGDKVLQALANTLKHTIRLIDIPCRYGGEEFALILPSTPLVTAIQVAERLHQAIQQAEIAIDDDHALQITASLGVSSFDALDKADGEQLIARADQQLYQAKATGRNRVCAETTTMAGAQAQLTPEEKGALFDEE